MISVSELHQTQPVAAQPLHEGTERGHGEIILVDDQSGRQTRQVGEAEGRLHGDEQVREETGASQEEGGDSEKRRRLLARHHSQS